jgi:hypothetical protein
VLGCGLKCRWRCVGEELILAEPEGEGRRDGKKGFSCVLNGILRVREAEVTEEG